MAIHFFWEVVKIHAESTDPNKVIQEVARDLISPPHFPFTHEDCDELDPTHNFRSDFILKLIVTAHLSKTTSAIDVQSLQTAKLRKGYGLECVVALTAATVNSLRTT